jgi:hypothetical protein
VDDADEAWGKKRSIEQGIGYFPIGPLLFPPVGVGGGLHPIGLQPRATAWAVGIAADIAPGWAVFALAVELAKAVGGGAGVRHG